MSCIKYLILSLSVLINIIDISAQYDTTHYIPPIYTRSTASNDIGDHYLFLSTNDTNKFLVTVTDGNGLIIGQDSISSTSPDSIYLGNQVNAIGIVDMANLNTVSTTEGLIATASSPFYANIRNTSGSQGISLTAKGNDALGQRFRSGHLYFRKDLVNSPYNLHSHFISVMATEDNTTIDFGDFATGLVFNNTPTTGNTSDPISIVLNQNETYVIGANLDEVLALVNDTGINNTLITSDKAIAVNCGSVCGGNISSSPTASRDNGVDQIVPFSLTGNEYVLSKRNSNEPQVTERVILCADTNAADVYINGSATPVTTIPAGEFYVVPHTYYNADDLMHISTDNNVAVYQTTNGSPSGNANAHGLNFIPPISCSGTKEVTIPFVDFLGTSGIDIITKLGATVSVNGGAPLTTPFIVPGSPNRIVYKLNAVTGLQNIVSDEVMNVSLITNSGNKGAAGYFSGFTRTSSASIQAISELGNDYIIEGCEAAVFIFDKSIDQLNEDVTFHFTISGDAINGTDYSQIPDSIVIPSGTQIDSLEINAIKDGLSESDEFIIISISTTDDCGNNISITDTLKIINYEPLALTTEYEAYYCPELQVPTIITANVVNGYTPYKYQWTPHSGSDSLDNSISVTPQVTTSYYVTITDACGYFISSNEIVVNTGCSVSVPNVFTPNYDDHNDLLLISHTGLLSVNMKVYNRWGSEIYTITSPNTGWDGRTFAGKECPEGTYYYVLNYEEMDGTQGELSGYITLLR